MLVFVHVRYQYALVLGVLSYRLPYKGDRREFS